MTVAEYEAFLARLSREPRGKLDELCQRLSIRVELAEINADGWLFAIADYGSHGMDRIGSHSHDELLAKAVALGVKKRLWKIAECARDIEVVDAVLEDHGLSYELARLVLGATLPKLGELEPLPPEERPVESDSEVERS